MPIRIAAVCGIIAAVRETVISDNPLSGGEVHVRGYEPADLGIVIAALEIVQFDLLVIDVAAITEGLIFAQRAHQRARDA